MAATLQRSGLDMSKLKRGDREKSSIQAQMDKIRANKNKSANDIIDDIYSREQQKFEPNYQQYLAVQQEDQNRALMSKFDKIRHQARLQELRDKI